MLTQSKRRKMNAFTMAEILLSLTIIGVVAAITLPSLMANINERTWNTQRKALYARMSQAISMIPQLNGYGIYKEESAEGAGDAIDTATETFITEGLAKVLKINNVCDNEHLTDCGIPSLITPLAGSSQIILSAMSTLQELNNLFNTSSGADYPYHGITPKTAAFETANGESILTFYKPDCIHNADEELKSLARGAGLKVQPMLCANFIYDLNGNKGPNTVGKDIGVITAIYANEPIIVAPMPTETQKLNKRETQPNATTLCRSIEPDSRIPDNYEAASIFYNSKLFPMANDSMWTSTLRPNNETYYLGKASGRLYAAARSGTDKVTVCIKKQ